MTVLLVTPCTNRKRHTAPESLQARNLFRNSQEKVVRDWWQRVESSRERELALQLYCGRGFSEALASAHTLGVSLWIISAGMGLIKADEKIPPYDLTLTSNNPNCICSRVFGSFSAKTWWTRLNDMRDPGRSLAWLVHTNPNITIVVTLTTAYAKLIQGDLLTLGEPSLNRVRLIGLTTSQTLPAQLRRLLMPYDGRLDGPDSYCPGTRSDFPQRATRHFVEMITATDPAAPAVCHYAQVLTALETMRYPNIPKRRRLRDDELVDLIERNWKQIGGNSARMLRFLRDEQMVACEQGRFSNLFNHVKRRMNS